MQERIHLKVELKKKCTSNNNYAVFKKITVFLDKEIKKKSKPMLKWQNSRGCL